MPKTNEVVTEKTTYLTYDEYIQILAKDKGVSIEEAKKIDEKENKKLDKLLADKYKEYKNINSDSQSIAALTTGDYQYVSREWTYTYSKNSNYTYAVVATFKIYYSGSFRQICNVLGLGSRRVAGAYTTEWVEMYHWQDPVESGMPCVSVNLGCTGYFEVRTNVSAGVNIPGFIISGSTGQDTIWQSDTINSDVCEFSVY